MEISSTSINYSGIKKKTQMKQVVDQHLLKNLLLNYLLLNKNFIITMSSKF